MVKKTLVICRKGFSQVLASELLDRFEIKSTVIHPAAVELTSDAAKPPLEGTIFARQYLPNALLATGSPDAIATAALDRLDTLMKRDKRTGATWQIHAFASDDDDALKLASTVQGKIKSIASAKYQHLHKKILSTLPAKDENDLTSNQKEPSPRLIVQVWGFSADSVYLSIASEKSGVSALEGGIQRMKKIPGAPSRSASKLAEALHFFNTPPHLGETAVDLGAAPGGWSYVLAYHGVQVTAVDHAKLDLAGMKKTSGKITHLKENGLTYIPEKPVKWLVCDMVMGAAMTLEVLERWLLADKMQCFVVNVKLPERDPWPSVKQALNLIDKINCLGTWNTIIARQLFHDRNEITLIGSKKL